MSFQGKLKQYQIIIERIEHKHLSAPTADELLDRLEEVGLGCSLRTLQRNFEALKIDFNIAVECNKSINTYYIDRDASSNIEVFVQFLQSAIQANFVAENMKDFKSISKFVHLSTTANLRGIQLLQPILDAIKENRILSFRHLNYNTYKHHDYKVEPYLLKEYLNRWYVLAMVPDLKEFRLFGLDRLDQVKVLAEEFKPNQNLNPSKLFENTIGLVYSINPLQPVKIKLTELQAEYIRSLPLHASQEEGDDFEFSYLLTPNYELNQRLLMLGAECEVLEPQWLRDEIKGLLKKALENYE